MASLALVFDILAKDNASDTFKRVGDSAGQAGGQVENGFGKKTVAAMGAVSAAIGGASLAFAGLQQALDAGRLTDRLTAQLGATAKQSEQYGRIAGRLYADAYGESVGDVTTAIDAVVSSIDGMRNATEDQVQAATADVLNFAQAFGTDVTEAANTAGILIRNGFAKDADQAFDLLVTSFQRVPAAMRDELPDILNEYGTNFRQLGFDGDEAFAVLISAAQGGQIVLDKTGDALKELSIRGTDLSETSVSAFEKIGLSAEQMANDLLAGGDTAREATATIAQGLLDIRDPAERANAAIALFGTPLEDLSTDQIPAFLTGLANADSSLGDVSGAADELGNTLSDNLATKLESAKRTAITFISEGLGAILSGFETGQVQGEGFIGTAEQVGVVLGEVAAAGGQLVDIAGGIVSFLTSIPGPALVAVGAIAGFVTLKGPVSDALETISLKALYARDSLGQGGFAGAAGKAKTAASGLLGVLGGPWGIALGAAAAGVAYVSSEMAEADEQTQSWTQSILNGSVAARDLNDAYLAQYGGDKPDWLQQQSELLGFTSSLEDAEANARALYDAMDPLAQAQQNVTYDTNRLVQAIDEFGEGSPEASAAADLLARSNERLAERQGAVAQATDAAELALRNASPTTEDFAAATERLEGEVSAAAEMVDAFRLALDQLAGNVVNTTELEGQLFTAVNNARTALEGSTGAVLDNSGALNTQSTAGVAAADALFGIRDAGFDLLSNQAQLGESTEQLTGRAQSLREQFVNTAIQMGVNQTEAEALADRYGLIPSNIVTAITADTSTAIAAVEDFVARVSGTRVTLTGDFVGGAGVVVRRAEGGPIYGPGTGTSDSIPAWLSNGEYVVKASSVDKYGRSFMDALNAGTIAAFAQGGLASSYAIPVGLTGLQGIQVEASGAAGSGAVGSGWQSIWEFVKARIPQARINSTYRPGDPGYHGRGKAIDFGFGSGPGGAGSAGLASINRLLHDSLGRNLAELIYDGIGDDRPDLKNGRPLTYSSSTRAQHRNHVHAATYDDGGLLRPGYTLAFNGTGKNETIRTAEQEAALQPDLVGLEIGGRLSFDSDGMVRIIDGRITNAFTGVSRARADRGNR